MKVDTGVQQGTPKDKHLLIAIDDSEHAKHAVLYVASLIGGFPGFRVTLLTIIEEPEEDYFSSDTERHAWVKSRKSKARQLLKQYQRILIQSGFEEGKVSVMVALRDFPTIVECVLDKQACLGCCTVVLGHRKKSRKEEFMFGSMSKKILNMADNCAVWIIQ